MSKRTVEKRETHVPGLLMALLAPLALVAVAVVDGDVPWAGLLLVVLLIG